MIRLAFAILCIALPSVALADEWSHTEELQSANTASIRVTEPEGYQVTINGRTDTAPAVFAVPNADNYFVLQISAPSGAHWERKIETKAFRQTVVKIRHVASTAPAAPAGKVASYVGVVFNTTHLCKKQADRRETRFEFVRGSDVIKVVDVGVRARVDAELPAGDYRVRLYLRTKDAWEFSGVSDKSINKDGWIQSYGCER